MDVMRSEGHSLRRGRGRGLRLAAGVGQLLSAGDKPLPRPPNPLAGVAGRAGGEMEWTRAVRLPGPAALRLLYN